MPAYSIKPTVPIINRRLAKLYGVVAAFPFSERGGTALRDAAGRQDIAFVNPGTWGTTPDGPAVVFNGTNSYAGNATGTVNLPSGNAPRSVRFRCRYDNSSNLSVYPVAWGTVGTNLTFAVDLDQNSGSGNMRVVGYANDWDTGVVMPTGVMTEVVVTHDGATVRLYLNGVLRASTANTYNTAVGNLRIGRWIDDGSSFAQWMSGPISVVEIYNRALTASEVRALYLDPWALYRPDRRSLGNFAVSSAVPAPYYYQMIGRSQSV